MSMQNRVKFLLVFLSFLGGISLSPAHSAEDTKAGHRVRYKAGKDVDFEKMLIQGELKRPEISVVTGNPDESLDSLVRLREDFLDRMTADMGEEIK